MAGLKGCRVLVVEDQYYLAKDIGDVLATAGAVVHGPHRGNAEARAALGGDLPEVAVLDINLGQGADFSLADELRAKDVPVVFVTGYDREIIPKRLDAVPRLEKPVPTALLVKTIEEARR